MSGSPYSPLKIIHHTDKLEQLKQGQQPVPLQVQLIISDLCNQDCSFCAYRMSGYSSNTWFTKDAELAAYGHDNPKRMIAYDKVTEILEDCRDMGVKAIQLTGGGEPTVHPQFNAICQDVVDMGMKVALVSNGALLHKSLTTLSEADWVRISIDAGNRNSYARIRNVSPDVFDRVWTNVERLVDKTIVRETKPIIGIGFVVTKDNYLEIEACVRRAKHAGVDNVRISAVFQPDDEKYFAEFYEYAKESAADAQQHETSTFKVFNLMGDRVDDLKQKQPDYSFCGIQHLCTYIGGDLNVYRCCVTSYNPQGFIGSLKNQRFRTLWESDVKKKVMDTFDARSCERCQFNGKNKTINYAIDQSPTHVEWV